MIGKKRSNISNNEKIVIFISFLILLRPHISIIPDIISVYIFDVVLILVLLLSILIMNIKMKLETYLLSILNLSIIYMFTLTMIFGINVVLNGFIIDTFFAYMKIIYYIVVLVSLIVISSSQSISEKVIRYIIIISFVTNIFIVCFQLLDLGFLSKTIYILFGDNKLRSLWSGYARVYGSFYNANWFALYLIIVWSYFNSLFVNNKINIVKYLILLIPLLLMFIVSGSRSGLIGVIVFLSIQLVINFKRIHLIYLFLGGVLIYILSKFLLSFSLLDDTIGRFTEYLIQLRSNEFSIEILAGSRWPHWVTTYETITTSPFFGANPYDLIPHNSYLAFTLYFGIFGLITILLYVSSVIYFSVIMRRRLLSKMLLDFMIGLLAAFFVVSLSGDYFFSTQIILSLILFFALTITSYERN